MANSPDDMLCRTLDRLRHYNLTDLVKVDTSQPKGGGGNSDVFVGAFSISPNRALEDYTTENGVKVAVKRFRVHAFSSTSSNLETYKRILAKEMHVWSTLYHRNVLPFLGFVLEGDYPLLIAKWMENGTLGDYLRDDIYFSTDSMVLGLANGVSYLHISQVIHSDLKSDNVLIGHLGNPLICDFGISHKLDSATKFARASSGNQNGTTRWMARELFDEEGDGRHTKASDVWAFGMTIFEILTGQKPYSSCNTDPRVMLTIINGVLPSKPYGFEFWTAFQQSAWEICELCWVYPPEDRITMEHIIYRLNSVVKLSSVKLSEEESMCFSKPSFDCSQNLNGISYLSSLCLADESRSLLSPWHSTKMPVSYTSPTSPSNDHLNFWDNIEVIPYCLSEAIEAVPFLDLTGCVQYDDTVIKATSKYSDIFVGTATITPNEIQENPGTAIVMKVAIKRLRVHILKDQDFEEILAKELYIWSKLRHTNILQLQGFILDDSYGLAFISQWMENGTLREYYLWDYTSYSLEEIILGIANGVDYLHGQNMVHSDLKSDSILINPFGEPLICGFGTSKMLYPTTAFASTTSGEFKGSMRWMAYELLDLSSNGHHTKESDVWAFGMTVYEILARQIPYFHLKNDAMALRAIVEHTLPSCPSNFGTWSPFIQKVWEICENCWITPPEYRITIGQVVDTLNATRHLDNPGTDGCISSCPNANINKDSTQVICDNKGINRDHKHFPNTQNEQFNQPNAAKRARKNESPTRRSVRKRFCST